MNYQSLYELINDQVTHDDARLVLEALKGTGVIGFDFSEGYLEEAHFDGVENFYNEQGRSSH